MGILKEISFVLSVGRESTQPKTSARDADRVAEKSFTPFPYGMNSTTHRDTMDDFSEAEHIRRFLRAAVDHYPRLAAFHFTLSLQPGTPDNPFYSFQRHMQESLEQFACQRQQQGKPTPPSLFRLMGASDKNGGIEIVMLLNEQSFHCPRHDSSLQDSIDDIGKLISETWGDMLRGEQPVPVQYRQLCRSDNIRFASQFDALQVTVLQFQSPVRFCCL
jgi:hypothetical protein